MEKIVITGGSPLKGTVSMSGAKNAALPLLAATLLTDAPLSFFNIPNISDIRQMLCLLDQHGTQVDYDAERKVCHLKTSAIKSNIAPYDIVRKMRASILVLGPLLARHKKAVVSLPGGCAIGTRPVNVHIVGFRALGADISIENGYIYASCERLTGAEIQMPVVSVTGTENLLMAATLAKGRTVIKNAAKEPEISDLARCLIKMGAKIEGVGSDTLVIEGVDKLKGASHTVIPDRIETATYALGAAITHGDLILEKASFEDLSVFWENFKKAGASVEVLSDTQKVGPGDKVSAEPIGQRLRVKMDQEIQGVDIMTAPYPGFPTDIQAQFMALMTLCSGASMITETIFENRFMHVLELCRMGANITVHHSSALVRGVKELTGSHVMATDIRASVSLVLAGLVAKGKTEIHRIYHLDRGYESLEEKLSACGANIYRAEED